MYKGRPEYAIFAQHTHVVMEYRTHRVNIQRIEHNIQLWYRA